MEKSSKRGKIPQSDWPSIMVRYESGETLASIARTYDCSPPAISYVVSRSRARDNGDGQASGPAPNGTEALLLKNPPTPAQPPAMEAPGNDPRQAPLPLADEPPPTAGTEPVSLELVNVELAADATPPPPTNGPVPNGSVHNGTDPRAETASQPQPAATQRPPASVPAAPAQPAPAASGDRRTLHLSLGGQAHPASAAHGNGNATHSNGHAPVETPPAAEAREPAPSRGNLPYRQGDSYRAPGFAETRPASYGQPNSMRDIEPGRRNGNGNASGNFIDKELRARVDDDIAAFLAAFDTVLAADTQESRLGLREATDRLLRAGARTRIELERLEARVPLPPRDNPARNEPAWRHR